MRMVAVIQTDLCVHTSSRKLEGNIFVSVGGCVILKCFKGTVWDIRNTVVRQWIAFSSLEIGSNGGVL
jgi:hypothetical protein